MVDKRDPYEHRSLHATCTIVATLFPNVCNESLYIYMRDPEARDIKIKPWYILYRFYSPTYNEVTWIW